MCIRDSIDAIPNPMTTIAGIMVHNSSNLVLPCTCLGDSSSLRRLNLTRAYIKAAPTRTKTTAPPIRIHQNIVSCFSATGPNASKVDWLAFGSMIKHPVAKIATAKDISNRIIFWVREEFINTLPNTPLFFIVTITGTSCKIYQTIGDNVKAKIS